MPIRVLPPAVAAAIAAGEVVERPASVIKELVENALDAGATAVTVELWQGGIERLRVTDNGCGIPAGEVELAFARHATSKLEGIEGLDRIATMGFRGEALPSIAAAGRVRMVTRETAADAATSVELTSGEVAHRGPESAAPGTTVTVDELFAGIPARRKFLRSPGAETGRVRRVMDTFALAWPGVRLLLSSDERTLLQTAGNGSLRDAVATVYGTEIGAAMLDLATGLGPYHVHGLVGPASLTRSNRVDINPFVNGRSVQHRALAVAIEEAYHGFLMEGRFPLAVVLLEVPPAEVDVNVHPTKREVRFLREGDAFSSVQRAVREALLAESPIIEARGLITPDTQPPGPALEGTPAATPSFRFTVTPSEGAGRPGALLPPADGNTDGVPLAQARETQETASDLAMPSLRVLGQIANTYVVAEGDGGMYLVDQHAAHEQVLFDRLLRQWEDGRPEVQPLLDPLPLELTPEQMEAIQEALPVLEQLGFQLEAFGDGTWLVRAVPVMARQVSIPRLAAELLDPQRDPSLARSPTHYAMAASIACHSAVRAGQALDQQEMTALVEALERARNSHHCPHGRPTAIRLSTAALEREFGRL